MLSIQTVPSGKCGTILLPSISVVNVRWEVLLDAWTALRERSEYPEA